MSVMADTSMLREPISDGSAWTREEIAHDRSWIYDVSSAVTDEFEQAIARAKSAALGCRDLSPSVFELPSAEGLFESVLAQLEHGRGMALVRGLPAEGKSVEECELLIAGLVAHLGTPVVQDTDGTLIDHVADRGLSYDNIKVRGYMTNAQLTPHCDSSDNIALLCVQKAQSGGVSTVSSALAGYNEILTHHSEFLETLYRGFYYNNRGNGPPGKYRDIASHRVPVYSWHAGRLSARFNQKAILTAEQLPGVPPLTEFEKAAVDKVAELALDPRFTTDVLLEPGDVLLLCNYTVFHNRSAFIDGDAPHEKRLLLRMWINIANGRGLTWEFGDHFNTGIRQGPFVAGEPTQIVVTD